MLILFLKLLLYLGIIFHKYIMITIQFTFYFSIKEGEVDKHPEKRMKAAYTAFEERRLKTLKEEQPTLRLSQLKQIIFKEWQKSPENPLNTQ